LDGGGHRDDPAADRYAHLCADRGDGARVGNLLGAEPADRLPAAGRGRYRHRCAGQQHRAAGCRAAAERQHATGGAGEHKADNGGEDGAHCLAGHRSTTMWMGM